MPRHSNTEEAYPPYEKMAEAVRAAKKWTVILPLIYSTLVVLALLSFACLVVLTRVKWEDGPGTLIHLAMDGRILPVYVAAFAITYFWTSRSSSAK
jgi:hypothetical protein